MSIEAILRRAAELTAKSEQMLSEPRPVAYQPPQPTRYRGYEVETLDDMLKASEARMNKRIAELDGRMTKGFRDIHGLFDALADEAGTSLGEVERKLRDEYRQEVESLRNEVSLLRAKAGTPQSRKMQTGSRAPFSLGEDHAFKN